MSSGRRFNEKEAKLNKKKVAAVVIVIFVLIMFVVIINKLLHKEISTVSRKYQTAYFTILQDGKWGVIDNEGKNIINPEYDEMIIIPDENKAVFICTYDVNYNDQTYKTKAIDNTNSRIFDKYETVEAIQNVDSNNKMWYEKNLLKVSKDGKFGAIDLDGKEIIKCEYDNIKALKGATNRIITIKDGKQGIIDNLGNSIISNNYKEISLLTDNAEDGYIVKNEDGKYGVVKANDSVILECQYEEIANVCGNNMYVVKENSKWKVVDNEKNEYLVGAFDEVKSINEDNILIKKEKKYGVVNKENEKIIPVEYKDLSYAFDNNYIAKKDKLYGVINTDNEEKIEFKYSRICYRKSIDCLELEKDDFTSELFDNNFEKKLEGIISEINEEKGYLRIRQNSEYKYYNFKFEESPSNKFLIENTLFLDKQNGKYGFVDKYGVVKVDYIYDDATEQNAYGYVAVKKDGLWGCIDQNGTVVVEPKYNLENNLKFNFIGEWHICEDVNSNYYTK